MSTLQLNVTLRVAGALVDADAPPTLAAKDGTYGVKRADTGAVVVAAGAAMARLSLGQYTYELTGAVAGVKYLYVARVVYKGAPSYVPGERTTAVTTPNAPSYLTVDEADAIAAEISGTPAWDASAADLKARALATATADVDGAMRYQGRPYDPDQRLQFPRVPHGPSPLAGTASAIWSPSPSTVWDWDDATDAAVVPLRVRQAVVYQADAILGKKMAERLSKQHEGLAYDQTASLAESYKKEGAMGYQSGLTYRAFMLMRFYAARTGELL